MSLPESKEADAARELAEAEANSDALRGHGARPHSAPDSAASPSPQLPQQPRHDRALEDDDDDSTIKLDTADSKEPRSSPPPPPCSVHVREQRRRRFRSLVRRVMAQLQSMDSAMRSGLEECKEVDADADLADAEASSESDALSGHGARTHADAESDPDAANSQAPQLPQQPPQPASSQMLVSPARVRCHDRALDDNEDDGAIEVDTDDYKEPRPSPPPPPFSVHVHVHHHYDSETDQRRSRFHSLVLQVMAKLRSIDSATRVVPHPMVLATGVFALANLSPPTAASAKAVTIGAAIGAGVAATAHKYRRRMILQILTDAFDEYLADPLFDHDLSPAVCAMLDELQGMRDGSHEHKALWQRAMDLAESNYTCEDGSRWEPHLHDAMARGALVGMAASSVVVAVGAGIAAVARAKGQKSTAAGQCSVQ